MKTTETRRDPAARRVWKLRVIKGLYERGLDRRAIIELLRLIDWLMDLPKDLQEQLMNELHEFEEAKKMPYVTHIERRGIQKGTALGLRRALLGALQVRLGGVPDPMREAIEAVEDAARLEALHTRALEAESLDEFRRALDETA